MPEPELCSSSSSSRHRREVSRKNHCSSILTRSSGGLLARVLMQVMQLVLLVVAASCMRVARGRAEPENRYEHPSDKLATGCQMGARLLKGDHSTCKHHAKACQTSSRSHSFAHLRQPPSPPANCISLAVLCFPLRLKPNSRVLACPTTTFRASTTPIFLSSSYTSAVLRRSRLSLRHAAGLHLQELCEKASSS